MKDRATYCHDHNIMKKNSLPVLFRKEIKTYACTEKTALVFRLKHQAFIFR